MNKVILTGNDLTIKEVVAVSRERTKVEIAPKTIKMLEDARQLVFDLVDADFQIYGFNVGVGWNKDKKVFKQFFRQYNENLIRSHCIGIPPFACEEEVRAVMLARLNTMLFGCTGVAPEIPIMYAEMLNHEIHPLVPERGSVGEGDIGTLSHIGLAIIGEGKVYYKGEIISSIEAFAKVGLKPLELGPKDGLAIVSSNAMGAGQAAVVLNEIEELLDMSNLIYGLSLEGFNGNTGPLYDKIHELRKYKGQRKVAALVSDYIEGSYIYEPDEDKAVHDPLSYRDFVQIHGAVYEMLEYAKERLEVQLNSTEDNPCLILDEKTIVPSSNFEPLNWVLPLESLSIALSHVSKAACYRIIKLSNPNFTKLPRFLSPRVETLGFATVQKAFTSMDAEIRHLCNPCSMDTFSLAGDMEDMSNNTTYVVQNLRKIVDNLRYIFALEIIHSAQAIDFRKDKKLGKFTGLLYKEIRKSIAFYDEDRNITEEILKAYNLIKNTEILKLIK